MLALVNTANSSCDYIDILRISQFFYIELSEGKACEDKKCITIVKHCKTKPFLFYNVELFKHLFREIVAVAGFFHNCNVDFVNAKLHVAAFNQRLDVTE